MSFTDAIWVGGVNSDDIFMKCGTFHAATVILAL